MSNAARRDAPPGNYAANHADGTLVGEERKLRAARRASRLSAGPVVEHGAAAQGRRDRALAGDDLGRVGVRLGVPFDRAREGVEPGHAVELLRTTQSGRVEGLS